MTKKILLKQMRSNQILYEGWFGSKKDCLEAAVKENANLDHADLRGLNLAHANLDGARLRGASFDGSNLMGANLSDAVLTGSSFINTSLQGACFCESDLRGCDFTGALFGNTDIAHARIDRSRFTTLSATTLNFQDCRSMDDCLYIQDTDQTFTAFSTPPLALLGLSFPAVLFERHMKISGAIIPIHDRGKTIETFAAMMIKAARDSGGAACEPPACRPQMSVENY